MRIIINLSHMVDVRIRVNELIQVKDMLNIIPTIQQLFVNE